MAILDLVGQGLGAVGNFASTMITNAQNMALQRTQWQREDNSMQRRMADLSAAGMNPVLAAGGSGSPTSITAHMQAPELPMDMVSNAVSADLSRQQMARTKADTQKAEMERDFYRDVYGDDLVKEAAKQSVIQGANQQIWAADNARKTGEALDLGNQVKSHDFEILKRTGVLSNVGGDLAQLINAGGLIGQALNALKAKGE